MPTFPDNAVLDYNFLRQEGIRHLERLAGPLWTDFNVHDPGITILEQLCYALTDLSYRIGYDLKDLLADGESEPYRSLYSPAEILTTNPVTLTDLRKVVIDVDGVKNAWIEPVEDVQPAVHYDPCDGSLYLEAAPHREPVPVQGVYRVLIERDRSPNPKLEKAVNQRLHERRSLGQDFTPAEILTEQRITVTATIEVSAVDDADRLLAEIYHALARCISPRIRFYTLAEMLARGKRIDEIMDGPVLKHGFIDTDELECFERKTGLRTSDLIQEIMNVKGVSAVNDIELSGGTKTDELWYLKLDKDKTPVLVIDKIQLDKIQLIRGGITALSNPDRVKEILEDLQQADRYEPLPEAKRDIRLAAGRDRQVGRYYSIQQQFPAVYGIGELGLPASAPALRQAQARQLKAYLLFFDQLLANYFAQLANVKKLFSFDSPQPQTYFSQVIDDSRLGLDDIWTHDPATRAAKLQKITEDPQKITKDSQKITENSQKIIENSQVACERKNRFLNHLLARFAEDFTDYSLSQFAHASPRL